MSDKTKRTLLFFPFIITCLLLVVAVLGTSICAAVLASLSLVSIPSGLLSMLGIFSNIVSDLAPPTLLFLGIALGGMALSIAMGIYFLFPKAIRLIQRMVDWFSVYDIYGTEDFGE